MNETNRGKYLEIPGFTPWKRPLSVRPNRLDFGPISENRTGLLHLTVTSNSSDLLNVQVKAENPFNVSPQSFSIDGKPVELNVGVNLRRMTTGLEYSNMLTFYVNDRPVLQVPTTASLVQSTFSNQNFASESNTVFPGEEPETHSYQPTMPRIDISEFINTIVSGIGISRNTAITVISLIFFLGFLSLLAPFKSKTVQPINVDRGITAQSVAGTSQTAEYASLMVQSYPKSEVFIDGKYVGDAPFVVNKPVNIIPGEHKIKLVPPSSYPAVEKTVILEAGSYRIPINFEEQKSFETVKQ